MNNHWLNTRIQPCTSNDTLTIYITHINARKRDNYRARCSEKRQIAECISETMLDPVSTFLFYFRVRRRSSERWLHALSSVKSILRKVAWLHRDASFSCFRNAFGNAASRAGDLAKIIGELCKSCLCNCEKSNDSIPCTLLRRKKIS